MQGTKATLTAVSAASSGGCNRSVGSFVWLTNSLLFYASHRGIVVYDVDRRQSLATLLGHQGAVTCVDGVALGADGADRGDAVFWLVSGSADGAVVMWEVAVASDGACRARAVSQVETVGPVTGVCCCRGDNPPARDETERETWRKLLVAAASGDGGGTVRVFGLSAEGLRVLETVHVGTLVACVCLVWDGCADMSSSRSSTLSPGPDLCVLAGGFVDGSVRLWGLDAARLCDEDDSRVGRSAPCVLRDQHQNWVRAIDITWDAGRRRMVMATASQDRYVRVWSLKEDEKGGLGGLDAYAPKPQLRLGARTVAVVCEGLLAGHEDWVHGARFHRSSRGVLTLLTSSMDRTMMMWRREGDHGVGEAGEVGDDQDGSLWQSVSVVGDAGVNHLGYYTCAWRPDGLAIATHGHSGALHVWNAGRPDEDGCLKELDGVIDDDEDVYYLPAGPCSCGHTGPVVDSSWSPDGTTLCTVSTDQTCRLWGNPDGQCWREVGRPQVHGHDFSCVAFVSNDVYVSGSEEKVARVFDNSLTDERGARVQVRLPALGLSNVVCQDARDGNSNKDEDGSRGGDVGGDVNSVLAKGTHASITEEDLSQNTLWPEIRKLYGHGNDLYRLVADPRGRFIASSSRAQEPVSAAVIVWDTTTWTEVARCAGHDLTVTCMDCNDSGDLLATVGRDRKLIVWERLGGAEDEGSISGWRIRASKPKAHARVIWGCAWANQEKEGKEEMRQLHRSTLITSARDGSISAWDVLDAALVKKAEIKLASSVTTVAAQGSLIAAGLESGHVVILVLREDDDRDDCDDRDDGDPRNRVCGLDVVCTCGEEGRHAGAVRRVHFCPGNKNDRSRGEASLLLSSVGDDGAVKFWRTVVNIHSING